jgi:protein-S-isoprenylcysteine O-methyltransferase Ste14
VIGFKYDSNGNGNGDSDSNGNSVVEEGENHGKTVRVLGSCMRASAVEYRLRYWVHFLIYALAFTTPWDRIYPLDGRGTSSWLALAGWPARMGWMSFSAATIALLVIGIVFAAKGAWLRTWGAAYLGSGVVKDGAMHGDAVVADGPYRYVRNPLYLGTWLHTLALALLMPPSGAVFAIVMIGLVQVRLIGAEEPFLTARLGPAYAAYCAKVRAVVPSLAPRIAGAGAQARWGQAVLGELYFWGVAASFAVAGWRYNAFLLIKCVIVSLGLSLVARAFVGKK